MDNCLERTATLGRGQMPTLDEQTNEPTKPSITFHIEGLISQLAEMHEARGMANELEERLIGPNPKQQIGVDAVSTPECLTGRLGEVAVEIAEAIYDIKSTLRSIHESI